MIIYDKTITIVNKLSHLDSLTRQDVLYKKVLTNCGWYQETVRNVDGTTVSIGSVIKVMIPFSDKFLPYSEWKKSGRLDECYTMSQDDIIILGNVEEDITLDNLKRITSAYNPDVCDVRSYKVLEKRISNQQVQLMIEGV